jgi:hypothetical protein
LRDAPIWRPIETAPKDGSKIIIWNARYWHCPIAWWGTADDGDGNPFGGWCFDDLSPPAATCAEGFIGYNEDIADGLMPVLWTIIPKL